MPFPLTQAQTLELTVCLTTLSHLYAQVRETKKAAKVAGSEGGAVIPSSLPISLIGRVVTPIHGLAIILPPLFYILVVLINRLVQPEWLASWRLTLEIGDKEPWVRIVACVALMGLSEFIAIILKHLGKQWHYLGVREKASIVSTGPYAFVRHPAYLLVLVQQTLFTLMFWSLIPLIAMGITVTAFIIKIPIEEQCLLDNPKVGPDYAKYQKKFSLNHIHGLATSGRIVHFDPAIKSRIHLFLQFDPPTTTTRKTLWRLRLGKVDPEERDFDMQEALKLVQDVDMNGREISNAVNTIRTLAREEKMRMSLEHFKTFIQVWDCFEQVEQEAEGKGSIRKGGKEMRKDTIDGVCSQCGSNRTNSLVPGMMIRKGSLM